MTFVSSLLFLPIILAFGLVIQILNFLEVNFAPNELILIRLIEVLQLSERGRITWSNYDTKRMMMKKLDDIALLISRYVYKKNITGDIITDQWSRIRFRSIGL